MTKKVMRCWFPGQGGINFVNTSVPGLTFIAATSSTPRGQPQLNIGDKPFIPPLPPYPFHRPSIGFAAHRWS